MSEFLCTRGRLAVELIEAGEPFRLTTNPWKPEYKAWLFPVNEQTRQIATRFYEEIGKPLPTVLRKGVREAHE